MKGALKMEKLTDERATDLMRRRDRKGHAEAFVRVQELHAALVLVKDAGGLMSFGHGYTVL